jgi:hypothetical protein
MNVWKRQKEWCLLECHFGADERLVHVRKLLLSNFSNTRLMKGGLGSQETTKDQPVELWRVANILVLKILVATFTRHAVDKKSPLINPATFVTW